MLSKPQTPCRHLLSQILKRHSLDLSYSQLKSLRRVCIELCTESFSSYAFIIFMVFLFLFLKISGLFNDHGKTYGVYAVFVCKNFESGQQEKWHIYRRYSDFYDLHQKIKEKVRLQPWLAKAHQSRSSYLLQFDESLIHRFIISSMLTLLN